MDPIETPTPQDKVKGQEVMEETTDPMDISSTTAGDPNLQNTNSGGGVNLDKIQEEINSPTLDLNQPICPVSKQEGGPKEEPKDNPPKVISMSESGPSFFYEDEVYRFNRKTGDFEFGKVSENWEMYSSSEDSEDEPDPERVHKGKVAILWHPSSQEEVVPESKVKLADRSLMPGDVVKKRGSTQRGYCRNVQVTAAVQILANKKIVPNVMASSLVPIEKIHSDVAVYLDSWVGIVKEVRYKLTLKFPDGSTVITDSLVISENFEDTRRSAEGFGNPEVYYVGQKLRGAMRYLKGGEWTWGSEELKRGKGRKVVSGVVVKVEPTGVSVMWQWQTGQPQNTATSEAGQKTTENETEPTTDKITPINPGRTIPPDIITGYDMARLQVLNLFESCTVQLGDIGYWTPGPKDSPMDKSDWKKIVTAALKSGSNITTEPNSDPESEPEVKSSTQIMGTKKVPRVSTRALRKKKLKKSKTTVVGTNSETQVVETIHTLSKVDVIWQDGSVEEGVPSVNLYPIHHLDDHEFFPGDFVVKSESNCLKTYGVIQSMDHGGRVGIIKWFQTYSGMEGDFTPHLSGQEEVSVYDIKDHPDFRFRPGTIVIRIGNLVQGQSPAGQTLDNYPDGQVRVWWCNNEISPCWPQDLFRLGEYDSEEGELWDDGNEGSDKEDGADSDSSWETVAQDSDTNLAKTPMTSITSLIKEVTRPDIPVASVQLTSSDTIVTESETPNLVPKAETTDAHGPLIPKPLTSAQFNVLESVPETHSYYATLFSPQNPRVFMRAVQKETGFLRDNLPAGILVKGYENRMDLFSVMIHGPQNTPYEDGLFLFDVQLPPAYPNTPPLVKYISFCSDRLNPNLYECGKVCVSLLGTWSGKGTEVWTGESSLLQLLVPIQGLILVPEPYYNEAGYEKQRGSAAAEENSRVYNEMVLIKLVQSMTKMWSSPHAPWETEIREYISLRGPVMIRRLRGWLLEKKTEENPGIGILPLIKVCPAEAVSVPGFSLLPVSKGFLITFLKGLDHFSSLLGSSDPPKTA